jgi:hypothetical protein
MLNKFKSFLTGTIMSVIMIGFLFVPKNAFSQLDCYEPPPSGVECNGPWFSETVTRSFPVFTACNITVTYSYRICYDNSCNPPKEIIQYNLGSIDIPDACSGLMQQLFPGYPDNWGGVINQAYWNMLVDAVFYTLGKEYLIANQKPIPNCTGLPPTCTAPTGCDNSLEVYYSQPKCRAYCVLYAPASWPGPRYTSVTPIHCDSQTTVACCEHRKYFCYCGGVLQVTNIDTYAQGNCNVLVEPIEQCPSPFGFIRHYIPCSSNCD